MSTFGYSRPFEYFGQNPMSSENHFFLNKALIRLVRVLGAQVPRLYGGTILGGRDVTHLGGLTRH